MGKFIITESEKKRILSLHKKLISEELNNDKENIVLTYSKINKWGDDMIYFNGVMLDKISYYTEIMDILQNLNQSGKLGDIYLKLRKSQDNEPIYKISIDQLPKKGDKFGKMAVMAKINNEIKNLPAYKKLIDTIDPEVEQKPLPTNIISTELLVNQLNYPIKQAIESIYKNIPNAWSNDRGGVINAYTLAQFNLWNDNWSILNFFNSGTIPSLIINEFTNQTNINPRESTENIEELKKWINNNKFSLFTMKGGQIFETLKQQQISSLSRGYKNEKKAHDFIDNFIKNPNITSSINTLGDKFKGYQLSQQNIPGSKEDRSGVDFTLVNSTNPNDKINFQAKPNTGVEIIKNDDGSTSYKVKSHKIYNLEKLKMVDYFIFVSDSWKKHGVICFEKKNGGFTTNEPYVIFNYPPVFWDPNY